MEGGRKRGRRNRDESREEEIGRRGREGKERRKREETNKEVSRKRIEWRHNGEK